MEPDVGVERGGGVGPLVQPPHRVGGDEIAGVAVQFADRLAVADEVRRVPVRGGGVVLRGEPPPEPVVARLRLGGRVELAVEVPLAEVPAVVPGGVQHARQRGLRRSQVDGGAFGNPVVHARPPRRPAGQQAGPARRADRRRRVELREPHALRRQPVDAGGLDDGVPVTAEVSVPEVVAEDEQDVRAIEFRRRAGGVSPLSGGDEEQSEREIHPDSIRRREHISQRRRELARLRGLTPPARLLRRELSFHLIIDPAVGGPVERRAAGGVLAERVVLRPHDVRAVAERPADLLAGQFAVAL